MYREALQKGLYVHKKFSAFQILKPGGYWVNLGPLLYHFSDINGEQSIEPSYKAINGIIKDVGFEFVKEKDVSCTYDQNPKSMLQYSYNCAFFTCKKS